MADDVTTGLKDSRPVVFIGGEEKPELATGLLSLLVVAAGLFVARRRKLQKMGAVVLN